MDISEQIVRVQMEAGETAAVVSQLGRALL